MSIPLVQNNEKDSINTSIIAIKRNIERINMLLGLSNSEEIDTSEFVKKSDIVDEVTVGNMQSVTSNAVAESLIPIESVLNDISPFIKVGQGNSVTFKIPVTNYGNGLLMVTAQGVGNAFYWVSWATGDPALSLLVGNQNVIATKNGLNITFKHINSNIYLIRCTFIYTVHPW